MKLELKLFKKILARRKKFNRLSWADLLGNRKLSLEQFENIKKLNEDNND